MSGPLVTVVIPTFRREQLVLEAVRSALRQNDLTVEVIVIDDSEEGSALHAILGFEDDRVRYVRRPISSGGRPAVVRNEGLSLANGRYVHFLDDDDILEAGGLTAMVRALERDPSAGVAVGRVLPFGDDLTVLRQQEAYFTAAAARLQRTRSRLGLVAELLFDATPLVNSACIIRRECALAVGGYSASVARCEDVDFYLRAIRRFGFVFVDRPVIRYRTGAPSLMHSLHDERLLIESYREIHRQYREERGLAEFVALRLVALSRRMMRRTHRPAAPAPSAIVKASQV